MVNGYEVHMANFFSLVIYLYAMRGLPITLTFYRRSIFIKN